MNKLNDIQVIGIGEALFDCLPDGMKLGGAPVNFTVHINRLLQVCGGSGILVSRVGDDQLGRQILSELGSRDVATSHVQIDPRRPTGTVDVVLSEDGQPEYTINENVAWDHLGYQDSLEALASGAAAVCFGSLGQRSDTSKEAIQKFLASANRSLKVLDVNLRQHYFSEAVLRQSFELANVVKINEEELVEIAQLFSDCLPESSQTADLVTALIRVFELKLLALTRGKEGTLLFTASESVEGTPVAMHRQPGADSVGAGDACCAGIVFGLLQDWPLQRIADFANQIGAFVASQPGATPELPSDLVALAKA